MSNTPNFRIEKLPFTAESIRTWDQVDPKHRNWPVVYTLHGRSKVYVGESTSASSRLRQHIDGKRDQNLSHARVVLDETANKSACLDLESYLIRLFAGDGRLEVLNRNDGLTEAEYFDRKRYQSTFDAIFEELRQEGLFERSLPEIRNSALFKLSPFKSLAPDQAICVEQVVETLLEDSHESTTETTSIILGEPGTGKTVVGIFLIKLLRDIAQASPDDSVEIDSDSMFSDLFTIENIESLAGFRIGLVIPQQSLRKTVQHVFRRTPGLSPSMVLSPWTAADEGPAYDLLVVDEAHRLGVRAAQATPSLTARYPRINEKLFGQDAKEYTQLDWMRARSKHLVLLMDPDQAVRPSDLPKEVLEREVQSAKSNHRFFPLQTQMRLRATEDYVSSIRSILCQESPKQIQFQDYDLRLFESFTEMNDLVKNLETEVGLSRMLAGYAWPWNQTNDPQAFDIEIEGRRFKWNSVVVDWVSQPNSINEFGSIHTIQGYDLNYAGVVIGPDLKIDPETGKIFLNRDSYFDKRGKRNNPTLGVTYNDDEILAYVQNIYTVLLTRGIRGTFIYAVDENLREYLRKYIPYVPRGTSKP